MFNPSSLTLSEPFRRNLKTKSRRAATHHRTENDLRKQASNIENLLRDACDVINYDKASILIVPKDQKYLSLIMEAVFGTQKDAVKQIGFSLSGIFN